MSVSLWLDASVLNTADAVVVPNRTTVNLRAGTGLAMAKQAGGDDIVLSSTATPSQPGVIGGHTLWTTVGTTSPAALTTVSYPFDTIVRNFGTPVVSLGPGTGEVTVLQTGEYAINVRISYIFPASRYAYINFVVDGVSALGTVAYSQTTANLLSVSTLAGTVSLTAGQVLKVTVEGWISTSLNYVTFDPNDTRWDITRIY